MYLRDSQHAIDAQRGVINLVLSPQAHDMMEIAKGLFHGGLWKSERVSQTYPIHWENLDTIVVPYWRVNSFGQPVYVFVEKQLLRDHTIFLDEQETNPDWLVVAHRDPEPEKMLDVHFEKTAPQEGIGFRGNIVVRSWMHNHSNHRDAAKVEKLAVYSAKERGLDTSGKKISDLSVHGLVVAADFHFHAASGECDGFVIVD